jgi:hypothetical protein
MNRENKDHAQPVISETAYRLLLKERNAGFLDNQTSKPASNCADIGAIYDNEEK